MVSIIIHRVALLQLLLVFVWRVLKDYCGDSCAAVSLSSLAALSFQKIPVMSALNYHYQDPAAAAASSSSTAHLPLLLLLPRAVFVLAAFSSLALLLSAAAAVRLPISCASAGEEPGKELLQQTPELLLPLLRKAADTYLAAASSIVAAPYVMVLSSWTSDIAAMEGVMAALVCMLVLLSQHVRADSVLGSFRRCCHRAATAACANGTADTAPCSCCLVTAKSLAVVAGCALSMLLAGQLFFSTGRPVADFTVLQYNSAFVGFDDVRLLRSGALLAFNCYGSHLLAAAALPMLCSLVRLIWLQAAAATAAACGCTSQAGPAGAQPLESRCRGSECRNPASAWALSTGRRIDQDLERLCILGFCTSRAAIACAVLLCAAVQQRLSYLYAPRLVVELVGLAVNYAGATMFWAVLRF